jgi:Superfamily II DNA/RNA helicases, SNF2 family
VRNRPALVRSVIPYDNRDMPTLHEVQVDYIDNWSHPDTDTVIWEMERGTKVHNRLALPLVDSEPPDGPGLLQAFLYANQWSAVNHLAAHSADDGREMRLISPWQSAVQVEDYQLYPVLKSLLMPRISLLLADDVGLGKTIETGLILSELFVRRRIRRVLIICPASLQLQWRDEMHEKFHLDFTIVDRDETFRLQRDLGIDSNPWASFPRIITSMDYLRQSDILSSFLGATRRLAGPADGLLPWQMLVVDEVHNLTPSNFGDNSDRCEMLRTISPNFEHRLFLSATPHNGYTVSFTGLLELLDPVRFQQRATIDEHDRQQIKAVMVRRLKSELNQEGMPDRFAHRTVSGLSVQLYPQERALFEALREYRVALREVLHTRSQEKRERHLGEFVVKLLTKRLLSSSYAFARTWWQHVEGQEQYIEGTDDQGVVSYSVARAEMVMNDDQERGQREEDALKQTGSWLRGYADALKVAREKVSACLEALGWSREIIEQIAENPATLASLPQFPLDARWDRLWSCVEEHLRVGNRFKVDERLIIFTEYKHSLDYLMARFHAQGLTEQQVKALFGGVSSKIREDIKAAFNDPRDPLRILVGTDTVSEGISLQYTCRYVLHQEIPWNPMRLEQRNGRVDRHGQERDVEVFHFSCNDEADLQFMEAVVKKVEQARADLGSVGQVIDQTVEEYFTQGIEDATAVLDHRVDDAQDDAQDVQDMGARDHGNVGEYRRAMRRLQETEMDMALSPEHCATLLMRAVEHEGGLLEGLENGRAYRFSKQPPTWRKLIKETLEQEAGNVRSLPKLVFDPAYFEIQQGGRRLFKPRVDAELIRLGHPLMQRALGVLRRRLWDNKGLSRWTLQGCELPYSTSGLLVLNLFLEITNQFREVVHQEVITLPFEVYGTRLEQLSTHQWDQLKVLPRFTFVGDLEARLATVHNLWLDHQEHIVRRIYELRAQYEQDFTQRMQVRLDDEYVREQAVFKTRLQELDNQREPKNLQAMQQEMLRQQRKLHRAWLEGRQASWLPEIQEERQQKQSAIDQRLRELNFDIEQAKAYITRMKELVEKERDRVLEQVLPKRYALATVDLQPLTVEYILRASRKEQ